jgi:hypothetical protein
MSNSREQKTEIRMTTVESIPAARHSWTDDRGNRHTMLSWDEGEGDDRINLQIHMERIGNYISLRVEEWDGNAPDLLQIGKGGINLEQK